MAAVTLSQTVRNIFGGISQVPAVQQDGSSFTDLTNAFATWGRRLGRRPGSQHVDVMSAGGGRFMFEMGDYVVFIGYSGVVQVYDRYVWDEQTVVNNITWGYLGNGTGLKAITVGEKAYVLNPAIITAKNAAVAAAAPFVAHVTVNAGDYETQYVINLDGTAYSTTTPAATVAGAKGLIQTTVIADDLRADIVAGGLFTVNRYGSTLAIKRVTSADFTVTATCGLGDSAITAIKDTAKTAADLPTFADALTVVQIVGEDGTKVDNYFVQYTNSRWQECTAPGQQNSINPQTMPVQITRNPTTGVFTIDQVNWDIRAAGDDTTNPFASFIGNTISDLFVYCGRLGFTSGARVALSEAGKLTNFFRTSASQILSSDPIDVDAAISGATNFAHALPWRGAIYLFTDRAQFVLQGGRDGITAESINVTQASAYTCDVSVRPVAIGQRIFFVARVSGSPRIMDYHMQRYVDVPEAVDVTAHAPTLINDNPTVLAGDEALGVLIVATPGNVFCYSYKDTDEGRVQSAWYLWAFTGGEVIGLSIHGNVVSMSVEYATSGITCFEQLDLSENTGRCVDRLMAGGVMGSFDGTKTTYTIPATVALDGTEGLLIALDDDTGVPVTITSRPAANQAVILGDQTSKTIIFGVTYMTVIQLPTLYPRDQNGSADDRGRLQLRFLTLNMQDTTQYADVTLTVALLGRDNAVYYWNNPAVSDGPFTSPVMGRNTDATIYMIADGIGQAYLTSYSWEGTEHSRTPRR